MWARWTWTWAAVVAWPAAVWAQQPGAETPSPGGSQPEAPTVNVGSATLPDIDQPSTPSPSPAPGELRPPEPPVPVAPAPPAPLLGPNDNPYRGPSVPASASYDNPYRGPSLKPPYDNPYRGPSAPAESLLPPGSAPTPPSQWGPPRQCPPGSPCAGRPPAPDQPAFSDASPGATSGSPFIDAVSGAFLLRDRVSTPLAFGGDLGVFVLERGRLSARALVPVVEPNDELPGQGRQETRSIWLWGFGAGLVVAESASFVLSPGLQYLRVAGGRHGGAVGVQVPFEWLLDGGLRLGFDFSVLYGFGGSYWTHFCDGPNSCVDVRESHRRESAPGVALNLILGQAFTGSAAND